eukprot:TRINITY_DN4548_c0_g1_i1.p1 TRINITY_DN4548_c0_g1~~TRINITY_DN4548_c0_g1_i1.p1  ORF type:complete len:180 (-),score=62.69 TRINITY_DN4548_c0_g1_i1:61-600(-)
MADSAPASPDQPATPDEHSSSGDGHEAPLSSFFLSFHDSKFVPSKPLSIVLFVLYAITGLGYYVGTYAGLGEQVALFFGITQDFHLMRNTGMLLIIMALLNLATALKLSRGITVFTFVGNVLSFVHFGIETFWHRAVYLSVMIPICLVVVVQVVNSLLLERKSHKLKKILKEQGVDSSE